MNRQALSICVTLFVAASTALCDQTIRVATFNASLYGKKAGQLQSELSSGDSKRAKAIAAIVQTVRPDILLINEIDHDSDARSAHALADLYFAKPQGNRKPLKFEHIISPPSNTGIASKSDLDGDGKSDGPGDCWGYGAYSGQYAFAVYSRLPIDASQVRSFQKFRWSALPGALRPEGFYSDKIWRKLRLSSKNHCDVPITIGDRTLHFLVSHPTPPVFDGPEDRNGKRNHDEIRFWTEYIAPKSEVVFKDDRGQTGSLDKAAYFVIAGDMNADAIDGSGRREAIQNLIGHPRVTDPQPQSAGAVQSGKTQGRKNLEHKGNPAFDTGEFFAGAVGNLRIDYVLPSSNFEVKDSGTFWPRAGEPGAELLRHSDHRLVWVDLSFE